MAGCRSCSGCSPQSPSGTVKKAEKLEKGKRSGNPRYPHLFVGGEAVYSDERVQMIVTVVADNCDDACDCFTLKPTRILKGSQENGSDEAGFEVTQQAGENCWRLRALI